MQGGRSKNALQGAWDAPPTPASTTHSNIVSTRARRSL